MTASWRTSGRFRARAADAVDAEDCQDGAWASRVDECRSAISNAGCDAKVDPGGIPACNEDLMCMQPRSGGGPRSDPTDERPRSSE
jgi:hypothetical protein